ncbi:hypothetical protein AB1K56_12560 [Microbacterium sp. BWR-S6Y]|uniref:hypothetical protein n=1 Tax=Microbacterium sp. BWR-S6Y TaxID=3232073 RepID=UPI003529AF84
MAYFIALGFLSLAGIIGTVWLMRTDGYGRIPTDPTRIPAAAPRESAASASTASRDEAKPLPSPAAETSRAARPARPAGAH